MEVDGIEQKAGWDDRVQRLRAGSERT